MTLTYTLLFTAALALINLWLSVRIARTRFATKVSIGDGANPMMVARMRAHANFVEYVPMALILMGLVELRVGQSIWLFVLGILLVIARILHPFGMERPAPNPFRLAGVALTMVVTISLIVWGATLLYAPAPAAGVRYIG